MQAFLLIGTVAFGSDVANGSLVIFIKGYQSSSQPKLSHWSIFSIVEISKLHKLSRKHDDMCGFLNVPL